MKTAGGTVHEFSATGGHTWKFAADTLQRLMPELCWELGPADRSTVEGRYR